MDVVVDEVVAILQVLTFGDAVGGDEHLYLFVDMGIDGILLFGDGREERQHLVEVEFFLQLQGASGFHVACDEGGVHPVFLFDGVSQVVVEVDGGVGEGGEDEHLLIVAVDGMGELVAEVGDELLQLAVVLGGDVLEHEAREFKLLLVALQILAPADEVDILEGDLVLLGAHEGVVFRVVDIQVVTRDLFDVDEGIVAVDGGDGVADEVQQARQREPEGVDRALQSLQHQDAHNATDTHLAAGKG